MFSLYVSDFTFCVIFMGVLLQGCRSQDCKPYINSTGLAVCAELNIDHGDVCYVHEGRLVTAKLTSLVTCDSGYDLVGPSNLTCWFWTFFAWKPPIKLSTCVPAPTKTITTTTKTSATTTTAVSSSVAATKHTKSKISSSETTQTPLDNEHSVGSLIAAYITIPAVIVLLIIMVLVIIVFIHRKDTLHQNVYDVSVDGSGTNQTGGVDSNEADYNYVTDSNIRQNASDDSEYNTIQMNMNKNISLNYSHVQVHHDDYYDNTVNISGNVHRETDTYSHLSDANKERNKTSLSNETDNVYDAVNGQGVKMDVFDEDPSYDHTDTSHGTEIDTYATVDN